MFKKSSVGKMVQRRGAVSVKTLFRVQVHKIIFPKQPKDITVDSDVSVCFERGGKIASSRTQKMQLKSDGTVEIIFEEALSLVVTMYREDSGKYQEKIGHIVIRQKSKSLLGGEMYKGLGIATFSLDTLANNYRPTDLSLAIKQCSVSGGIAEISVTPKFLGESDGAFDETMSMQSGISDNQINAAEFESIRADSSVADDHFHHQDSMASQNQDYEDMANKYHALCEEHDKQRQLFEKLQNDYRLSEERGEEMAEQITVLENQILKLNETKASTTPPPSSPSPSPSHQEETMRLQHSIDEKDDVIQQQLVEMNQLTEQIQNLKKFLEEKTQEISEVKETKEKEEKEHDALVTRLQSTISELSDAMAMMNSENGRVVEMNEKFQKELETKNSIIGLKDTELHQQAAELTEKRKEIEFSQQKIQEIEKEMNRNEEKTLQLMEEMRVKFEEERSELQSQLFEIQNNYCELERQSLSCSHEKTQLQHQLHELYEQLHEESQRKSETSTTLLSLQDELSSVTCHLTSSIDILKSELENEKIQHQKDLQEMQLTHEKELQEREEGHQQEILKLQEKFKSLEATNQKLEERLATVLREEGGLSEEFQKVLQENSEMRGLLEVTQEEVKGLKKEKEEVSVTSEGLTQRLKEQQETIMELTSSVKSSEENLISLTTEMNSLQLEVTSLRAEKETLQKELQELESTSSLQKAEALAAMEAQIEELKAEMVVVEEEKRGLQSALEEQEQQRQRALEQVKEKEQVLLSSEKETQQQLQEMIRNLESEVMTLKDEALERERKWKEMNDELVMMRAVDAEKAEEERAKCAQECQELMLQMSSMESSHEEKLLELNEEMKHCQEEKLFLHEKLGDVMKEKKRLEEKIQEQESSYSLLQQSFQQISLHEEEVNKKYTDLMNEFHEYKIQHQTTSPSAASPSPAGDGSGHVGGGSDVLEEESVKYHEVLRLKVTFEEENLYLKNQVKLLEAEKEESEQKIENLQEQLHTCQLQLQEFHDNETVTTTLPDSTTAAPASGPEASPDTDAVRDLNSNVEELRCDLEQLQTENDELITQLIETKLQVAYHATETDEERKKLFHMKRKLQLYAERVASLEVTVAERLAMNESTNGEKKFRWGKKK